MAFSDESTTLPVRKVRYPFTATLNFHPALSGLDCSHQHNAIRNRFFSRCSQFVLLAV